MLFDTTVLLTRAGLIASLIISSIQPVVGYRITRSYHQFAQIPKTYQNNIIHRPISNETQCLAYYERYTNTSVYDDTTIGHQSAVLLDNCIIEQMQQYQQSEMGAISVVLGLLPAGLTQIGLSTSHFSLLASRRPVLATLLSFGALTVLPMDAETLPSLRQPVRVPTRPGFLGSNSVAIKALVTTIEYLVALGAVANVLWEVYFLTYQSVCWAAIQLLQMQGLPETVVPLFWALFPVVAQLLSHLAMWIQLYRRKRKYGEKGTPYEFTTWPPSLWTRVITELTPSSWGSPLVAPEVRGIERGSLLMLELAVTQVVNLCSIAHVFMGTIILSTMQFISLRNAVIILVRLLSGTIIVRAVVQYELHGMREVSQEKGLGRQRDVSVAIDSHYVGQGKPQSHTRDGGY
ncbi:hypothetical protein PFICI_09377 [Pestalotiopsis fici W106-1]|uniref:Uncharacterized protein n=1 Tax=Pestalotiopsis fici (strain W106-1 / CGMCC3.15140) TaxID=1229662 RepID=W3X0G8_PESFW|nr:uncharacterized protein PFICI_09377 [Pestalotiopsis fici W106-1]ETS79524.1 hypothetical protein PFICI_09377 [Pestalotiopsis fici W106-1]